MTPAAVLKQLPVGNITPSPYQTRSFSRKASPDMRQLTESVKAVGVLEPVIVRPNGKAYELVAGERRLRAAKLAKLETIPAVVRAYTDDEAAEACITENLHREDLHPLEQGHAISLLLAREGWTVGAVAAQVGRSEQWVARRSSVWTRLTDPWKELAAQPDHPVHGWPVARLEVVARLEEGQQDVLFGQLPEEVDSYQWQDYESTSELARWTEREFTRELATAPWRCGDAKLLPDVGACTQCPARTSRAHLLFDNAKQGKGIPKGDRCLNPDCWQAKDEALIDNAMARCVELYEVDPVIVAGYEGEAEKLAERLGRSFQTCTTWDVGKLAKEPHKGSVPVVMLLRRNEQYGQLLHGKLKKQKEVKTKGGKLSQKEKEVRLARRRNKLAVELIFAAVCASPSPPKPKEVWALSALIGTTLCNNFTDAPKHQRPSGNLTMGGLVQDKAQARADKKADAATGKLWELFATVTSKTAQHNALAELVWYNGILPVIRDRAKYYPNVDVDAQLAEVSRIAELVNVDAAALTKQAVSDIPTPKSWYKAGK